MDFERLGASDDTSTVKPTSLAEKPMATISAVSTILRNQKITIGKDYAELLNTGDWEESDKNQHHCGKTESGLDNETNDETESVTSETIRKNKNRGLMGKIRNFVQKLTPGENVPYQNINLKDFASCGDQ